MLIFFNSRPVSCYFLTFRSGTMLWCGVRWGEARWCDVMWCDLIWCDVIWCDVIWCDVIHAKEPRRRSIFDPCQGTPKTVDFWSMPRNPENGRFLIHAKEHRKRSIFDPCQGTPKTDHFWSMPSNTENGPFFIYVKETRTWSFRHFLIEIDRKPTANRPEIKVGDRFWCP